MATTLQKHYVIVKRHIDNHTEEYMTSGRNSTPFTTIHIGSAKTQFNRLIKNPNATRTLKSVTLYSIDLSGAVPCVEIVDRKNIH